MAGYKCDEITGVIVSLVNRIYFAILRINVAA
jgi:hypothetical protein